MLEIIESEIKTYQEFKVALDGELQKAAEGFVRIGWLLKQARDTDILFESGYANVNDFAMAEYGIDKSVVSRYIRINDRFSEGGNSPLLRDQYREYGYAKLAIMIQLPEEITEELSPELSKAEIQIVKEEYQEEMAISDIEVMLEEPSSFDTDDTLLGKVMKQLMHDDTDIYLQLCTGQDDTIDILAPAGLAIHHVRIPGMGRLMMSINDEESYLTITNIRSGEKETFDKQMLEIYSGIGMTKEDAVSVWEHTYSEPWPVKEEPRNEEKPKQEEVQESKKEKPKPKVTKADKKPKVAPVQPDTKAAEPDEVENVNTGEVEEDVREVEETLINQNENVIRGYKSAVTNNLNTLRTLWDGNNENKISLMLDVVEDLKWRLQELQKGEK